MGLWDATLDRSVVFSFDATGFRRHARRFDEAALAPSLEGRVVLVTGANAGIGRAAAGELARRGATVYLLCRSIERGREAQDELRALVGHGRVRALQLDVSDLSAVRALPDQLPEARVDVLVHNAGVLPPARRESPQGYEETWATHILGPLALTAGLRPKLHAAPEGRVIFVSSGGMYTQRLDLTDLEWRERPYDGVTAYAQTKRMQVELTALLAERLAHTSVTVHAMHPGWADTRSVRESLPRFHKLTRRILRTAEEGADTVVFLSAARALAPRSGGFWFDRCPAPAHLMARTRARPGDAEALWQRALGDAGVSGEAFGTGR
ncbi:MAG: SDR family NAD(P)-dependent oxidoreductase [Deltaproteobacteria bacterium]|nr:SDR family NAD(P)-dependent oxidoreductase [Deltaproteobacteria bacterium]